MASLGFIAPPPPKILGPPLIYLVGPLAISDPQGFPQVLQTWRGAPQNLMVWGA